MNDTFETIFGFFLLIGSFFIGRKTGYTKANHEYTNREHERDIASLRQEIDQLRKQQAQIIQKP